MASAEKIDEVIRLIVANYDPDEIMLFGSHARGNPSDRSDVDMLILKETDEPFPRRVRTLQHLLQGMLLRFDINVYTRRELERAMEHPYSLIHRVVTRQARTVYSKRFPDYDTIVRAWEREDSAERHARLQKDPSEWKLFQMLYERDRAAWKERPADVLARRIAESKVKALADLGSGGDLRLAELLKQVRVTSVDHVAAREGIVAADLAALPFPPGSFEAAAFSLSLIGRNWRQYLAEAARILRKNGLLFLAEPRRRAGDAASRLLDAVEDAGLVGDGKTLEQEGFVYVTAKKP
ncbi:MAG TPA: methyltransferase domain-containing protein [Thermoanaerobaculia bacterium]